MSSKALWYLTRGSGAVSLVLLTVALVLGILMSARWVRDRWPRFVVEGLHRNIALLAPVFVGIHIASAVVDGYVPIRWIDAVVPFGAAYSPFWLGLGALALDVFAAVAITSLLRARLGLPGLAHRALAGLRLLGARHRPRHRDRQRPDPALDAVPRPGAVGSVLGALAWRIGCGPPCLTAGNRS